MKGKVIAIILALSLVHLSAAYSQTIENSSSDNDYWTISKCGTITTYKKLAVPFTTPAGNSIRITSVQMKQHALNYTGFYPFVRIETPSGYYPSNSVVTNGASNPGACNATGGWITMSYSPGSEPVLDPGSTYFMVLAGDQSSTIENASFRFNNTFTAGTTGFDSRWSFAQNCGSEGWADADTWTYDDLLYIITYEEVIPATYCAATSTYCDEFIANVQVGSINNTSSCTAGGYHDYTAISTNFTLGMTYPITVTNGYGYTDDECGIWIDWNQDGDFDDASETITVNNSPGDGEVASDGPYTANITVPGGAALGTTRMRTRIVWSEAPSACGVSTYGETEDYTINVEALSGHTTIYTCNDIFTDSGGDGAPYGNNEDYMVTYTSANYSCIRAVIDFYEIESGFDYLYIYDGADDNGTLLKVLNGSSIDTDPTSTLDDNGTALYGLSGSLTFKFYSDGAATDLGWKIYIECPENCVPPVCSDNSPASDFCETSTPICNLDGYCGNTGGSYSADHTEMNYSIFCGSIENNSWLSFLADNDTAQIAVWVYNCTGIAGNPAQIHGIQIQVYESDCSTGNFTPVSNCWSPNTEANGLITATGLVPGQQYLIMIDGWGADACEYSFAASSGIVIANAGQDATMCEGQIVTLEASGGNGFNWSTGATTQSINVSPSSTTTYTVTVTGSNPDCPGTDDVVVFVNSAVAEFTGLDASYCLDDITPVSLTGDYPTSISDFAGPGITNDSVFTPSSAGLGSHNIVYTYNYSVVTAFYDGFDPNPLAGWTHGGSNGDSWGYGDPNGGNGSNTNSSSNPDPLIDHSANIENNVYGQGLTSGIGNGIGGHYNNSNEWLLSPPIDCSELSNTVLSFWRYANFENIYDEAYVAVSNNGSTWTNLSHPAYPQDEQWTQVILDISAVADGKSTVYIRWQSISDVNQTYSGWNIDDVTITGVRSGGECISTETQSTTVYAIPTSDFSATDPLCSTSNSTVSYSGTATAGATYNWNFDGGSIVSGSGQGPYAISWSSGTSHTVSLSVTENGCSSGTSNDVVSIPSAITLSVLTNDANCGGSDGSASVTPSGGTGPYSYNWSSGSTTNNAVNLMAGSYGLTVTDANGCTKTTTVNISNVGGPSATASVVSNVSCFGGSTGSASVSATGGVTPYTYNWSGGAGTSATVSNLAAGDYNVTVTSSNGCSSTASVTISQPGAMTTTITDVDVACYGNSTGSVTLSVSGGTPSYSYSWNNGSTSQNLSSVSASTYSVEITDANGCTTTAWTIVSQPSQLIGSTNATQVLCNSQSTGAIDLTVTGGTTPFAYSWSSGQSTQDLSGIPAANYSYTITDANGCTSTGSQSVTQPSAISITNTTTGVTCYGDTDGTINISVSGGVPSYSYNWSNGNTGTSLTNLAANSYFLTVTDANSCSVIQGFSVSSPTLLSASSSITGVACYGAATGVIDLTASGGTPSYSYSWTGPNGYTASPANGDLSGLYAGAYQVTVTDNHLCTTTATATIQQPGEMVITTSFSNSSCGNFDGVATVDNVSGGISPYTYLWNTSSTGSSITGLSAGSYTVSVTDANSCIKTATVNISDSDGPQAQINTWTNVNCFGASTGSATVSQTGGTAPYNYFWSAGAGTGVTANNLAAGDYSVTVTDNLGCSSSASVTISQNPVIQTSYIVSDISCNGATDGGINLTTNGGAGGFGFAWSSGHGTEDISSLGAGSYTVTVTDGSGCTATTSAVITEPSAINSSITIGDANCGKDDGSALVSASGGSGTLTYSWSTGNSGVQLNNVYSGTYTVTISDANGCSVTNLADVGETDAPVLTLTGSDIQCYGDGDGSVGLSVTGGTTPYSYSWNTGATSSGLAGLSGGVYAVTVTDANGCEVKDSVEVDEPAQLALSLAGTNVSCAGDADGAINLTVSGGSYPYNYDWNNGAFTQDLTGLSEGTYEVTVSDASICTASGSIFINEPGQLVVVLIPDHIQCNGQGDGGMLLSVTGGSPAYSFLWSNGSTEQSPSGLNSGTYTVTITDAGACSQTATSTINEPSALLANITATNSTALDASDGSVDLEVIGGQTPYSYIWSNFETTQDITGLSMGTYSVTISDGNGCTLIETAIIAAPDSLLGIYGDTIIHVLCNGQLDGAVEIIVGGGAGAYSYAWSNGETTQDISNLSAGSYTITITDANSVQYSQTYVVTQPDSLVVAGYVVTDASCDAGRDGSIEIIVDGGVPAYSYLWNTDPVQDDSIAMKIGYGDYSVTVTDQNGCTVEFSATVLAPDEHCLQIPNVFTPNGDGSNDVWEIKGIEYYPGAEVEVYNRWGTLMYKSADYASEPWDGTYNGNELPISSFVYVVKLNDESDYSEDGVVSIVR